MKARSISERLFSIRMAVKRVPSTRVPEAPSGLAGLARQRYEAVGEAHVRRERGDDREPLPHELGVDEHPVRLAVDVGEQAAVAVALLDVAQEAHRAAGQQVLGERA